MVNEKYYKFYRASQLVKDCWRDDSEGTMRGQSSRLPADKNDSEGDTRGQSSRLLADENGLDQTASSFSPLEQNKIT